MDQGKYLGQELFVPGHVEFYRDDKSEHQVGGVFPSV